MGLIVCFGRTSYQTLAAGRIMNGKFQATGMVLIHGIQIHRRLAASFGELKRTIALHVVEMLRVATHETE